MAAINNAALRTQNNKIYLLRINVSAARPPRTNTNTTAGQFKLHTKPTDDKLSLLDVGQIGAEAKHTQGSFKTNSLNSESVLSQTSSNIPDKRTKAAAARGPPQKPMIITIHNRSLIRDPSVLGQLIKRVNRRVID